MNMLIHSPCLDGVPVKSLVLVRVQGGLQDCQANANGDLVMSRKGSGRDDEMNTFHFSLNGVVSNHVYGKFDHAFVILSPLTKTCSKYGNKPSGLSSADTWFHADAKSEMTIPDAVILAPFGSSVPNPLSHLVRFYPSGDNQEQMLRNRNIAASGALKSMGAPAHQVGMHGWIDAERSDPDEFSRVAAELGVPKMPACCHANSIDDHLSTWMGALRYAISDFDSGSRLYLDSNGVELPLVDRCEALLSSIRADANRHLKAIGDPKATQFFDRQIETLSSEVWRVSFFSDIEGDLKKKMSSQQDFNHEPPSLGGGLLGAGVSESARPPPLPEPEYRRESLHARP